MIELLQGPEVHGEFRIGSTAGEGGYLKIPAAAHSARME